VTVDRSWPVAEVPEGLLQTVNPLPVNAGEWVALLDGLQATGGDASAIAVQVAPVITIHLYLHRVLVSIYEAPSRKVDVELKRIVESVKTANTTAGQALKKAGA
jgi:hypothetical protein